jgi:hypothetical protein
VNEFVRLFMAPGVGHCAGGDGPNPVGVFEAVVDWVEKGVAPNTLRESQARGWHYAHATAVPLPDDGEVDRQRQHR